MNSFHLDCINPPIKCIPKGNWYCDKCITNNKEYVCQKCEIEGNKKRKIKEETKKRIKQRTYKEIKFSECEEMLNKGSNVKEVMKYMKDKDINQNLNENIQSMDKIKITAISVFMQKKNTRSRNNKIPG